MILHRTLDRPASLLWPERVGKKEVNREEIVRVSTRCEEISQNAGRELRVELGESRERWGLHLVVANVDEKRCRACGRCVEACPALAVALHAKAGGTKVARVDVACCRGCGACAATCITGAVALGGFEDAQVLSRARGGTGFGR